MNAVFFPSEILHLLPLPPSSSPSNDIEEGGSSKPTNPRKNVVICHKDRISFYKSTRKVRRTATRVWSWSVEAAASDEEAVCVVRNAYYIGKRVSSPSLSLNRPAVFDEDDEKTAICKRLTIEFGNLCDTAILTLQTKDEDEYDLHVTNYNSDEKLNNGSNINVIFIDLDAILENNDNSCDGIDHFHLIQPILTSSVLIQNNNNEDLMGGGSIVHIRSEVLYRITTMNNTIGAKNGVSGDDILQHCLSLKNDTSTNNNKAEHRSTIRRLRDKKGASNCPLVMYPPRYIELSHPPSSTADDNDDSRFIFGALLEICRFHNYDTERGCLRSKKARMNVDSKGCRLDHHHCHNCGEERHRAFECPNVVPSDFNNNTSDNNSSVVFRMISSTNGNRIVSVPYRGNSDNYYQSSSSGALQDRPLAIPPALIVLGGRLRGRTLATCEMLPLSSPSSYSTTSVSSQKSTEDGQKHRCWYPLPNLFEHRGSHAACSPTGSKVIFVMGGGTADGNSDVVELLDFTQRLGSLSSSPSSSLVKDINEWRWRTMKSRLSSPRHAFGAVSCSTPTSSVPPSMSIFAVGGWKYGSVSCESMEKLNLLPHHGTGEEWTQQQSQQQWEICSPLLLPRRLHSVVASADDSSIYVLGGFINERTTTCSIERYDICTNKWTAVEELPFHEHNCPLVQAVADVDGTYLIFPFSSEQTEIDNAPLVLRYKPGSNTPFLPISIFDDTHHHQQTKLKLPLATWHSFSVTKSKSLNKAYLVGGTINGKWTNTSYEIDLTSFHWTELPPMTFPRRRLAAVVLE